MAYVASADICIKAASPNMASDSAHIRCCIFCTLILLYFFVVVDKRVDVCTNVAFNSSHIIFSIRFFGFYKRVDVSQFFS